jgi:hypothetical protein
VSFGVEPASAQGPDGRPYFDISANPGATVSDHVVAVNYSAKPLKLQLYSTDALESTGGGLALALPTAKPLQVGAWTVLPAGSETVVVPPESSAGPGQVVVPLAIHIPWTASPGDHAGGVVVSLRTVGTDAGSHRIIFDQRVGTRIFIRVTGLLHPAVSIGHLAAHYEASANPVSPGRVRISYTVTNTGNADMGVRQSVQLSRWFGASETVRPAPLTLLLAGGSVTETAVINSVWPAGRGAVTVKLQSIAVPGIPLPASVSAQSTTPVWLTTWWYVALVVVVVAFAGLVARRHHRKRRDVARRNPAPKEKVAA